MKQKKVRNRGKSTMPIQSIICIDWWARPDCSRKLETLEECKSKHHWTVDFRQKKKKPKTAIRWKEEENQIKEAKTQKREWTRKASKESRNEMKKIVARNCETLQNAGVSITKLLIQDGKIETTPLNYRFRTKKS